MSLDKKTILPSDLQPSSLVMLFQVQSNRQERPRQTCGSGKYLSPPHPVPHLSSSCLPPPSFRFRTLSLSCPFFSSLRVPLPSLSCPFSVSQPSPLPLSLYTFSLPPFLPRPPPTPSLPSVPLRPLSLPFSLSPPRPPLPSLSLSAPIPYPASPSHLSPLTTPTPPPTSLNHTRLSSSILCSTSLAAILSCLRPPPLQYLYKGLIHGDPEQTNHINRSLY